MKKSLFCCVIALLWSTGAGAADISLPAPLTKGGPSILEGIENRASAKADLFPVGAISNQELGTLLWAATGRNRGGKGWTVPAALSKPPYVSVYVAGDKGVFLYEPLKHVLIEATGRNIKDALSSQTYVAKTPYVLIFVVKAENAQMFGSSDYGKNFYSIMVGSMTQNVYLASQALNISVRFMASIETAAIHAELKLGEGDIPIGIMPLGHN